MGGEPVLYTTVEVLDKPGGLCFSLRAETGPDGGKWVHEIPLQALADRMELLGLDGPEEALEAVTEAARDPELGDEVFGGLHGAYGEVARAEAQVLYAAKGQVTRQTRGAQTVLGLGLVCEPKREELERVRRQALERLGLGTGGRRTRVAEAEGSAGRGEGAEEGARGGPLALRPSPRVVERVCEVVREHAEEVEAFRVLTALSHLGVGDGPSSEPSEPSEPSGRSERG